MWNRFHKCLQNFCCSVLTLWKNHLQPKITEFKLTHECVETHKNTQKCVQSHLRFDLFKATAWNRRQSQPRKILTFLLVLFKFLFVCLFEYRVKIWKTTQYQIQSNFLPKCFIHMDRKQLHCLQKIGAI